MFTKFGRSENGQFGNCLGPYITGKDIRPHPGRYFVGLYVERSGGRLRFRWVKALTRAESTQLANPIAHRVGRRP